MDKISIKKGNFLSTSKIRYLIIIIIWHSPANEEKIQVFFRKIEQYQDIVLLCTKLVQMNSRYITGAKDEKIEALPDREILNSKLDELDYHIKLYGMLGIKSDKILKLTSNFEMEIYEVKGKVSKKFQISYYLKDLASIIPKNQGSQKLIFNFKNPVMK